MRLRAAPGEKARAEKEKASLPQLVFRILMSCFSSLIFRYMLQVSKEVAAFRKDLRALDDVTTWTRPHLAFVALNCAK